MHLSLDYQTVELGCPVCRVDFTVVRGSVYDAGVRLGLYLAALHGHSGACPSAELALSVRDESGAAAAAMQAIATTDQIQFHLLDGCESPWWSERYLGVMLDRREALESPLKPLLFHVAEHLVNDLPKLRSYLDRPPAHSRIQERHPGASGSWRGLHAAPARRTRGEFILHALVGDEPDSIDEQLWTRQLAADRYEICCIPFFAYDVSLGDIVAGSLSADARMLLRGVVERSGHWTLRAWFGSAPHRTVVEDVQREVRAMGHLVERYSGNLLAFDVEGDAAAMRLREYLDGRELAGELQYETGWT